MEAIENFAEKFVKMEKAEKENFLLDVAGRIFMIPSVMPKTMTEFLKTEWRGIMSDTRYHIKEVLRSETGAVAIYHLRNLRHYLGHALMEAEGGGSVIYCSPQKQKEIEALVESIFS